MACNGTLTARSQSEVDAVLNSCAGGSSGASACNVCLLSIENYTDQELLVGESKHTLQIESISIKTSQALESIVLANLSLSVDTSRQGPRGLFLSDLPMLSKLTTEGFDTVGISLIRLPKLTDISSVLQATMVPQGVSTTVVIQDTGITSIGADEMRNLSSISHIWSIMATVANLTLADNPNLKSVEFQTFYSAGNITVSGSPNVSIASDSMAMASGIQLSDIGKLSLPQLTNITNNFVLASSQAVVLGLDSLVTVGGDVAIQAPLAALSLPALKHVGHQMRINSTEQFDCSSLNFTTFGVVDSTHSSCLSNAGAKSSSGNPSNTTSVVATVTPEPASTNIAAQTELGAVVGSVLGLAFLVALTLWICWRRRSRQKQQQQQQQQSRKVPSVYYGRVELEQQPGPISTMAEVHEQDIAELRGRPLQPLPELEGPGLLAHELEGDGVAELGGNEKACGTLPRENVRTLPPKKAGQPA